MFTGLVQAMGTVREVLLRPKGVRLSVDGGSWKARPRLGDSICVAGVCLTLAGGGGRNGRVMAFDVVQETLDKTRLGDLAVGDRVNLEQAATLGTLLGGHLVQGHVDGVGRVTKVRRGEDWGVWIDVPKKGGLARLLVSKGSVCVEGVSLTIAGLTRGGFWVALIPTTLAETTLGALEPGDAVNLEMDVIAKMVAAQLKRR